MKHSIIRSVCGIILSLLIIVGSLPLSSISASAASIITSVSIVGIEAPVPGQKPNYSSYPLGACLICKDLDDSTRTNGIVWIDETSNTILNSTDTFIAGHSYRMSVLIKPINGFEFRVNGTDPDMTAAINSVSAQINPVYKESPSQCVSVYRSFGECGKKTILSEVSLSGVTSPFPGRKPTFNAYNAASGYKLCTALDDSVTINGISWIDNTDNRIMNKNDEFIAGHFYSVSIYVEALDGYSFSVNSSNEPTFNGYVNSKKANIYKIYKQEISKRASIGVSFGECKNSVVSKVSVSIDEPAPGKTPSYTAQLGSSAYSLCKDLDSGSTQNGITWVDNSTNTIVQPTDKFISGHSYSVSVFVQTATGFEFEVDSSNNPNVAAKTNSVISDTNKVYKKEPKQCISVIGDFGICKNTDITSISIINVPVPRADANPQYELANVYPTQYYVRNTTNVTTGLKNGIRWIDSEGNILSPDSTFKKGEQYTVAFYVQANEGYEFLVDSSNNPSLKAFVNFKEAKIYKVSNEKAQEQLYISYTFSAAAHEQISSVAVESISSPAAGYSPDYSASTDSSAYKIYTDISLANGKNGIFWKDSETLERVNPNSEKFMADHSYDVNVAVIANPGYEFAVDSSENTAVTGTINSNKCNVMGIYGYKTNSVLILSYKFDPCEYKIVDSIVVESVKKPTAGEKAKFTASVSSEGCHIITDYNEWNFKYGVRFYEKETFEDVDTDVGTFKPETEYYCNVILEADENFKFDDVDKISASINGINASIYSWDTVAGPDKVLCLQCLFPKTGEAESSSIQIENVSVSNVTNPRELSKPDFTAAADCYDEYDIYDVSNGTFVNGISWYDVTDSTVMDENSRFAEEHVYRADVLIEASDGYEFAVSGSELAVSAVLNGETADAAKYDTYDPKKVIMISYQFSKLTNTDKLISEVKINSIVEPKDGEIPSFNAEITPDSGYELLSNGSIGTYMDWYHADTKNVMYSFDGAEYLYDKFEAGKKYICDVYLFSEEGYSFIVDGELNSAVEAYINAKKASASEISKEWDTRDMIKVSIEFECPKKQEPKETCMVTFETFGHGVTVIDQIVEKGQCAVEPEMPKDEGEYTFSGWYADEKLTIKYDFSKSVNSNIILYAKWVKNSTPSEDKKIYGDVDGDGKITSADSLMILRASVNLVTLTAEQKKLADVDEDNSITSADALEVLRTSVKLATTSKAGQPFEG